MSDQGSLYHLFPDEVSPPEKLWSRINAALDEAEKEDIFAQLRAMEIEPPEGIWQQLEPKIEAQEVSPKFSFGFQLVNAEVEPPAAIWQKIEKELDRNKIIAVPARKINIRKIAFGITAAAACLAGIVLISNLYKVDDKITGLADSIHNVTTPSENKLTPTPSQTPALAEEKTPQHHSTTPDTNADTEQANGNQVVETVQDKFYEVTSADNNLKPINTTENDYAVNEEKQRDLNGNIIDKIGDYVTTGAYGYLMAIGPNGNSVRVSGKLQNMIEFFDDKDLNEPENEEYLDQVMKESNVWKQRLKTWMSAVNGPDAAPPVMNFTNPIDLLRFLDKNK